MMIDCSNQSKQLTFYYLKEKNSMKLHKNGVHSPFLCQRCAKKIKTHV